jgi:signal transduction histidine kinase
MRLPSGGAIPVDELPAERATARGETINSLELLVIGPEEQRIPMLVSATPVFVEGRRVGAVVVFQDIHLLKELERLREEWTAVIAHDLRQPVAGIALSAELLATFHARGQHERVPTFIERIKQSTARLQRMIEDLLDASRIEAHRLSIDATPVDLGLLIAWTCAGVPELKERALEWAPPSREIVACVDRHRVEQILTNLLTNACKYGDPDGPIGVELVLREQEAEIIVSNRGPGLEPEERATLFQRFARSREAKKAGVEGIGLGLYITKGLVEAHGGRIWVESTPHESTRFHFTLPRRGDAIR